MPWLRRDRRLGGNLRQPQGLGFADAPMMPGIEDYGGYDPLTVDQTIGGGSDQPPIQDQPQPGDVISDPIAPPAPNVPALTLVVTDKNGGTVAMPTTTTATGGTNATDGSARTVAPMTAPDNTVIPAGSYVNVTDQAWVITYPDGSSRIIYANQPIVDPECANLTTADINAGKYCQYNIGVPGKPDYFEYRYIPTERWTGQVQSAGELRANMALAAALNVTYSGAAQWNVYFNNPSWHFVLNGDLTKLADYPDDFVPKYIGPTTTSGGSTMYVVEPETGDHIDVTGGIAPEDKQRVEDAIYGPVADRSPGQPGYVPPVYTGPPIDSTGSVIHDDDPGSVGGGNGGNVRTPGGVSTTVNAAPSGDGNNTGLLIAAGLAAFLFLGRRR
jgi:hypothetical protein